MRKGISVEVPLYNHAGIRVRKLYGPDALEIQRAGKIALKYRVGAGAVVVFQFVDDRVEIYDLLNGAPVRKPVQPKWVRGLLPVAFDLPCVVVRVERLCVFAGWQIE